MQISVYPLSNRVRLHFLFDDRFKSELLSIHFRVPLDTAYTAERALLPAVLKAGCAMYPTEREIATELEKLYGADIVHRVTKSGDTVETVFSLEVLYEAYALNQEPLWHNATDLLLSILYAPMLDDTGLFRQKTVDTERREQLRTISERYDYKDVVALDLARAAVCGHHPYALPPAGTREQTLSVTAASLTAAYREMIDRSEVSVFYAGPHALCDVMPIAKKIASHHSGELTSYRRFPVFAVPPRPRRIRRNTGARQTQLVLAYRLDLTPEHPLWHHHILYLNILSNAPRAKLFKTVRERDSLCYSVSAQFDSLAGILYVTAGVDEGNEKAAVNGIRREIANMKAGRITPEELREAKVATINACKLLTDKHSVLESWYFRQLFAGSTTDPVTWSQIASNTTIADLTAFAAHLHPAASVVLAGKRALKEVTGG